jgi:hypothetical protein
VRSWFHCTVGELPQLNIDVVAAQLTRPAARRRLGPNPENDFAWVETLRVLQRAAEELISSISAAAQWHVGLEFEPARSGRRVDVVILARDVIFLIEVKAGAMRFDRAAKWQVEQYALDLRDFHEGSRDRVIVPIALATGAMVSGKTPLNQSSHVTEVQTVGTSDLGNRVVELFSELSDNNASPIVAADWEDAGYRPVPTIVDAATRLYQEHDVRDISASESDNLHTTVDAVIELIERCRRSHRRGIAFITGAPGSGKTLAGLQVVHDTRFRGSANIAGVFLSGNRPLVEVIREALAASTTRTSGIRIGEARRRAKTLIQHAYLFRDEYAGASTHVPPEHVVLFDEAQRAWDADHVSRKTSKTLRHSEPRIILDAMSRLPDWAVVIAMVGGGQEINTGEAGLAEWGDALSSFHPEWVVWAAPDVLPGAPDRPGGHLFMTLPDEGSEIMSEPRLHLAMNVRSPRAERLNQWVDAVLRLDTREAAHSVPGQREFPLALTRSLDEAKAWLRDRAAVHQRFGLVCSPDAKRLRAWGLDTSALLRSAGWADWFLKGRDDVRSSYQLEVPATSFDCQGLELDWTCICWGNDFTFDAAMSRWRIRDFAGTAWRQVRNQDKQRYILNSYRVLLTRARRGQVIWVPLPTGKDDTLDPEHFDATADFLLAAGAEFI